MSDGLDDYKPIPAEACDPVILEGIRRVREATSDKEQSDAWQWLIAELRKLEKRYAS